MMGGMQERVSIEDRAVAFANSRKKVLHVDILIQRYMYLRNIPYQYLWLVRLGQGRQSLLSL